MAAIPIPKGTPEMLGKRGMPCWYPIVNTKKEPRRPNVQCNCGQMLSIGNHHIHPDGRVTNSFFHDPARMPDGCGWHEYITLLDWDGREWMPGRPNSELEKDFE